MTGGRSPAWLAAVGLLASASALAVDSSLPALPGMARALDVSQNAVQLVVASYLLGFALAQIPLGLLSDRFGRLPVACGGLLLYITAGAVCALAQQLETVLAARVLQGLGGAAGPVMARAMVRDVAEGPAAARLLSLISALLGAGMVVAPLLGGALAGLAGWRATIALPPVLALVTLVLLTAVVGETHRTRAARGGPALAQLKQSVHALAASAQSLAGLTLFAIAFSGQMVIITQTAPVVAEVYGLGAGWVGPAFALAAAAFALGAALARRLAGTVGLRAALEIAILLIGVCALALALCLFAAPPFWFLWAIAVVYIGAIGLLMPVATAITLDPLGRVAGFTSSVLGTVQIGVATLASTAVAMRYDGTERAVVEFVFSISVTVVVLFLLTRPLLAGVRR